MNGKIGNSEGASAVAISMLPVFVYKYLGEAISELNSAFWINFLLTALVVYLLSFMLRKSTVVLKDSKNSLIIVIFNIVFLVYIFSFGVYTLYLGSDILKQILPESFSKDTVLYFILLASCACSVCGMEALSRTAYIMFYVICLVLIIMSVISFRGWTLVNYAPVLGNDIKSTFFSGVERFIPFFGLVSVSFLSVYYKDSAATFSAYKKSFFMFSGFAFAVTLLCILCTPYPLGDYYLFSLSSVFSLAKSGVFFHNFEIFLLTFVVVVNIMSFSYCLHLSAACICKLSSVYDHKPYALILSLLSFCIVALFDIRDYMLGIYIITSVLLLIFLLLFSLYQKFRRNNEIY